MKTIFAGRMKKYVGKPFVKGGHGPDGYDCVGFLYAYLSETDHPLPEEFEGWTLETYPDLYTEDLPKAEEVLLRLFDAVGAGVEPNRAIAGDVVIVRHPKGGLFPAVYIGNNTIISAFIKTGVAAEAIEGPAAIVKARRVR